MQLVKDRRIVQRVVALLIASLCITSVGVAQTRTLVGRVTDARTGEPVTSGRVEAKGIRVQDRLRPDGVFILRIPTDVDIELLVKSVGYRTRTVTMPANQVTALIALEPDAIPLDGIGTTARGSGSVATSTLRGSEVNRVPTVNATEALHGKIAGAQVQQSSNAPGGNIRVALRGAISILGSTMPLYVLDGVILQSVGVSNGASAVTGGQNNPPSRITDLNPNDIASIEVLKGSAASAMYGSKGSNGVIIIRTKRR